MVLRRVLGRADISIVRAEDGWARDVFRVVSDAEAFYAYLAEDSEEDLSAEAAILGRLRDLGVRVPEIAGVVAFDDSLQRSVMVITGIRGVALAKVTEPDLARRVARAAGRDAALLNSVEVEGFGWIRREGGASSPRAELADHAEFVHSYLPPTASARAELLSPLIAAAHLEQIEAFLSVESARGLVTGRLAHGDLDTTPIFCDTEGYTGLIDFSELRGAEPEFDLGHFLLHDAETNPTPLFEHFLAGYAEVAPDVAARADQIRRSAVLLGLRQLCIWLARDKAERPTFGQRFRAAQIANLLDGLPAATPRPR